MKKQHIILIIAGLLLLGALSFFLLKKQKTKEIIGDEPIKIIDVVDQLEKHPTKRYGTRSLLGVNKIIVHHSGGRNGSAQQHAHLHVNTNDWPGIGYHFDIQKDGTILLTNRLETLSYHSLGGVNTSSIGIVLDGNFEVEQPTAAQIESLRKLIAHLRGEFIQHLQVSGHSDHKATSCPGANLYPLLQEFQRA